MFFNIPPKCAGLVFDDHRIPAPTPFRLEVEDAVDANRRTREIEAELASAKRELAGVEVEAMKLRELTCALE